MEVKLVPRDKNATKPTPVTIYCYFKGKRFHYPTGEKVLIKHWDAEEMRLKVNIKSLNPKEKSDYQTTNISLALKTSFLEEKITEYKRGGIPITVDLLRQVMDERFNENRPEITTLDKLADHIIKITESGKRKNEKKNKRVADNTIVTYRHTLQHIEKFKGNKLIDTINKDNFYTPFLEYCETAGRKGKPLSTNSIGQFIRLIKFFMNYALSQGWTKNTKFKEFETPQEEVESIYLNSEEIEKIYRLPPDAFKQKSMEHTKDLFCAGCWTGLRISDLRTLSLDDIIERNGEKRIQVITRKTKKKVTIPLNWIVEEVLNKYQGMPPVRQSAILNIHIKKICEMAGIDSLEIASINGEKKRKYEMVSMHTARRSFCTNCYLMRVPTATIMNISGHTSESSFKKYIRVSDEEHSDILAGFDAFQSKMSVK